MVAFVVDNSVALAWAFPRQATAYTESLLDQATGARLHTAFIWPAEFANAVRTLEKRGLLSEALGTEMIGFARTLGLAVAPAPDLAMLHALSRQYRLTAYDSAYLELAMRHSIPLATRDEDLARAAASLGLLLN